MPKSASTMPNEINFAKTIPLGNLQKDEVLVADKDGNVKKEAKIKFSFWSLLGYCFSFGCGGSDHKRYLKQKENNKALINNFKGYIMRRITAVKGGQGIILKMRSCFKKIDEAKTLKPSVARELILTMDWYKSPYLGSKNKSPKKILEERLNKPKSKDNASTNNSKTGDTIENKENPQSEQNFKTRGDTSIQTVTSNPQGELTDTGVSESKDTAKSELNLKEGSNTNSSKENITVNENLPNTKNIKSLLEKSQKERHLSTQNNKKMLKKALESAKHSYALKNNNHENKKILNTYNNLIREKKGDDFQENKEVNQAIKELKNLRKKPRKEKENNHTTNTLYPSSSVIHKDKNFTIIERTD